MTILSRSSCNRQERVGEFGGEGVEFSGALGRSFDLFLLADEPVAIGLNHARARQASDQIRGLAIELEASNTVGCDQRTAVAFTNADEIFIHWKGDDLETARTQLIQEGDLLLRKIHEATSIAG